MRIPRAPLDPPLVQTFYLIRSFCCCCFQLFTGGDDLTDMLRGLNESTSTQHAGDSKAHRQNIRDHIFDTMNRLRQDEFLCYVTLRKYRSELIE